MGEHTKLKLKELTKNKKLYGSFSDAVELGDIELLKGYLKEGVDINYNKGYALQQASVNGDFSIVKFLVDNGANPNINEVSALKWAGYHGYINIFDYLIENKAVFDDNNKKTILLQVLSMGNLEMIKHLIINYNVDCNIILNVKEHFKEDHYKSIISWVNEYKQSKELNDKLEDNLNVKHIIFKKMKV